MLLWQESQYWIVQLRSKWYKLDDFLRQLARWETRSHRGSTAVGECFKEQDLANDIYSVSSYVLIEAVSR